ncbi:TraR/DksA family transcriptional regulator [Sedimentisphaera salicampi]|uniref:General stress protein 16O n=2 Tax=Sedimentisphaera salicampi TaxID=1941349 RepID=A0A1W6LJN1_9BACT|nr:TraR/DksA C4-type zinc finger protein [Sedimentisphaera salicampi]ARN55991.1 General stress protein 16O [Sedimentisphaera salicampi]OXU15905.1 General stress protein 16O [Sedimentisphaera salicampi]
MAQKKSKKSKHLTNKEMNHFKYLLLKRRAEILGDFTQIENDTLKNTLGESNGDLSSMPIHMADLGSDNYSQDFALNLMKSERETLSEITHALQKFDKGTYGLCEATGEAINKKRLEAKPWARYCIAYARLLEKNLVREGQEVNLEDYKQYLA